MNYIKVWRNGKRVREHIKIVEKALEHELPRFAQIHHRDGNGRNNKSNNLIICENQKYHKLIEIREKAYRETGDPNKRQCNYCKKWDMTSNLDTSSRWNGHKSGRSSWFRHRKCYREFERNRYHTRKESK